jgi:outer membrane lipoprotein-sorting protein
MRNSLALLTTLAVIGGVVAGRAKAETVREILDQLREVNAAREPKDVSQKIKMTLVGPEGTERVRELRVYAKNYSKGASKSIIFFEAPAEVKGVSLLVLAHPDRGDDQWLYFPQIKRPRRITANARRGSFQGSDFAYEDLELLEDIRHWTEDDAASLLVKDDVVVDGLSCAEIELRPKGKNLEYGRIVLWVHRPDSTVRKLDFHGKKDDASLKTLILGDFKTIDGIPTPQRLEMVDVKKGSRTLMELSEVRYSQGLADEIFTEPNLERGWVN